MDDNPNGKRRAARALAEQAVHAETIGDQEKAEALFAEAERIDPDETLEVLREKAAGSFMNDRPTSA